MAVAVAVRAVVVVVVVIVLRDASHGRRHSHGSLKVKRVSAQTCIAAFPQNLVSDLGPHTLVLNSGVLSFLVYSSIVSYR